MNEIKNCGKNKLLKIIRKPFRYSFFGLSFVILLFNVLVYFLTSRSATLEWWLGLSPMGIVYENAYWQFFTYMFVHGSFRHLLYNMLTLFLVGATIERELGSWDFLLFFIVDGVFSGIISFLIYLATGQYFVVLVGASGALYGLLFLYSVMFPSSRFYVFGIIPVRAPLLIFIYAAIEICSELSSLRGSVAHLTHLAGFVVAWLYCLVRFGVSPIKAWKHAR